MDERAHSRRLAWAFALLAAPFFLNDFANLLVRDWRVWLTIDYVFLKLVPLAVILWAVRAGVLRAGDFGLRTVPWRVLLPSLVLLTLVGLLIDQNGYTLMNNLPGYAPLGGMPAITSGMWNWIDLTVGLALVGLMEELIFRGLAFSALSPWLPPVGVVGASAVAFGLIHWSLGWHSVVITGVIGAVFMLAYLRLQSIAPLALAHFAVNFVAFAGVVPREQLKFF